MHAVITIFKVEFIGKEELKNGLLNFSADIRELGEAYIIAPLSGELFHLLNFLKENKISYGTHFNTADTDALQ
jgi:hypothetical protein